jgi:hypothetical protein
MVADHPGRSNQRGVRAFTSSTVGKLAISVRLHGGRDRRAHVAGGGLVPGLQRVMSSAFRSPRLAEWSDFALLMLHCARDTLAPLHRRAGIGAAERVCAVGGPGDIEVEGEMLVDGEHVAQVPLQRIAGVEALRAVA